METRWCSVADLCMFLERVGLAFGAAEPLPPWYATRTEAYQDAADGLRLGSERVPVHVADERRDAARYK